MDRGVRLGGLEPDECKPRSSTISRSCSDHAGLRNWDLPPPPRCSRPFSRFVAAMWQRDSAGGSLKTDFKFTRLTPTERVDAAEIRADTSPGKRRIPGG
jgi:hypothetical protein